MNPQIIVCDDEQHVIRAISMKFHRADFDVHGATDVESCWRLLKRTPAPSFLIVDDFLPTGPQGLELVRRVRGSQQFKDLPIVLLASDGFDLDEYKEQLAEYELAQILTKPFSPRELLATVCRVMDNGAHMPAAHFSPKFASRISHEYV